MTRNPARTAAGRVEFVAVGVVLGSSGVLGDVGVRPLTQFPERLPDLQRVRVAPVGPVVPEPRWREVLAVEKKGHVFVFTLEGVTTKEEAGSLRGALLQIPVAEVMPLPEGHYYRFEIVGLEVRDERGKVLGTVRDIIETGANDVYVVRAEDAEAGDGGEILLPALKQVVLRIDTGAGFMIVRPQPGWGEDLGAVSDEI